MSIAAGKSAAENRWVKFSEVAASVQCDDDGCMIVDLDEDALKEAQQKDEFVDKVKEVLPNKEEKSGWKKVFSR